MVVSLLPDIAEMRAILTYITEHSEEWNQKVWAARTDCGTAYCFAGHAVVRKQARMVWDGDFAEKCRFPHRRTESVDQAARRILRLSEEEADDLFYCGNTLEDLREQIDGIERDTLASARGGGTSD